MELFTMIFLGLLFLVLAGWNWVITKYIPIAIKVLKARNIHVPAEVSMYMALTSSGLGKYNLIEKSKIVPVIWWAYDTPNRVDKAILAVNIRCALKRKQFWNQFNRSDSSHAIDYGEAYDFHHSCGDR